MNRRIQNLAPLSPMSSLTTLLSLIVISLSFLSLLFNISTAQVPASETFRYVNEGSLSQLDQDTELPLAEYTPTYRTLPPLDPNTGPDAGRFRLCFYNTTPNAYTLALRVGFTRRSTLRWVWEANRGRPVRENATLSLGTDGNLILAEADGQVVWQTNTANKGVVGFAIQADGNVVLRDSNGSFVWQSFDSPTDTLLVGQSLRVNGGPYKLVSRDSVTNNVDGVYSLVLEPKRLSLFYKDMLYWAAPFPFLRRTNVNLTEAKFKIADAEYEGNDFHQLDFTIINGRPIETPSLDMGTLLCNSTLSYLRLGIDGNLRVFTFRPLVRTRNAWFELYRLFDRDVTVPNLISGSGTVVEDECQLHYRCGKFGLCENSQCVGCPTPNGVVVWSKECDSKPPGCNPSGFKYYELKGVDHFTVKYTPGSGRTSKSSCENRCTKDCKCLGYFYNTDSQRCWVVNELNTLTRVGNSTHLAYIKTPI
uniref:EP1-like glycoprotein 3 n=1 Tax=Erigeron canadensis TaxID=72917 RepID=UPI001CB9BD4E|nr:EP1-like glycoprotein 3 [Erigeron canadensis]